MRQVERTESRDDAPAKRKALELLSRELARSGESQLALAARELAWAEPTPIPAVTQPLTLDVQALDRAEVERPCCVTGSPPARADPLSRLRPRPTSPGPTRRTLILRIVLAVVLVVLALAASETGRTNAAAARGLLPGGGTGVLVLDVSRSIKPSSDRTIVAVLQELIHAQTRLGLVAFSDIAYELLPPGTKSRELQPLLRFFEPSATPRTGSDPIAPNPWSSSFSGGTQISLGLELARQALIRAGNPKGSILLVSDLDTAPDDVPRVAQTFNTFRNEGVKFRIVALGPRADNLSLFREPCRARSIRFASRQCPRRGRTDGRGAAGTDSLVVPRRRGARAPGARGERALERPPAGAEGADVTLRWATACVVALAAAVLALLLALDVGRWQAAFARGDVRFKATPTRTDLWQTDELCRSTPHARCSASTTTSSTARHCVTSGSRGRSPTRYP